jgi:anti-sigma-K factor RskA
MRSDTMAALEEKVRSYEDELMRLRVENEQLRQSSQAFGELAERLSVALRTATRVNRRHATAADSGGWRRAMAAES